MQEVQHLPELTMPERRAIARSDLLVGGAGNDSLSGGSELDRV